VGRTGSETDSPRRPAFDYVRRMRVTAVLTQADGQWLAQCEEVDRAGEGRTPDEALASLREALRDYFSEAQAVAPPPDGERPPPESIEIIVTDDPRSPA
jgi:predicted RNase H-like HicB family nuclease